MSAERSGRHNFSRTVIPGGFVDLGRLIDEDSRREYLREPDPIVRSTRIIDDTTEPIGSDDSADYSHDEEDFIIHENGITWLSDSTIAQ